MFLLRFKIADQTGQSTSQYTYEEIRRITLEAWRLGVLDCKSNNLFNEVVRIGADSEPERQVERMTNISRLTMIKLFSSIFWDN